MLGKYGQGIYIYIYIYMVGGIPTPSEKYESQLGPCTVYILYF